MKKIKSSFNTWLYLSVEKNLPNYFFLRADCGVGQLGKEHGRSMKKSKNSFVTT